MSLMSVFKGFVGETMGSIAHKVMLDSSTYRELNNVTIPTPDGTTQIDHILVSRYGIFVIEAKNMNGWIFGNEKYSEWTQSFPGGKFKFQNPLRQNYRHTKCLSKFLGVEHDKFHSVVMFWGESTFKTKMPENVLDKGYSSYIKSKTNVLFSDTEVDELVEAIKTGKLPRTWATRKQHIASLKERHSKPKAQFTNTNSPKPRIQPTDIKPPKPEIQPVASEPKKPICPLCSSSMIQQSIKRGANAGKEFWECTRFPTCSGIITI